MVVPKTTTLTVSEAKRSFVDLSRAVEERGELFRITRNGLPAAVLVSAKEWESLLETLSILSDPEAMRKVARARAEIAAGAARAHEGVWTRRFLRRRSAAR